ncbi:hypothetical protein GCM10011362_27180 [Marinobacter halophilus]|nr:hypothetical protein GCM10011362_27180 [Marinobacter halophilus]
MISVFLRDTDPLLELPGSAVVSEVAYRDYDIHSFISQLGQYCFHRMYRNIVTAALSIWQQTYLE